MSVAAIEARLDALGGLYRLGMSLAEADGPPIPASVWLSRSLRVHYRIGVPASNALSLAVEAGKLYRVGDELDLVTDAAGARILGRTRLIIVGVSVQGAPRDEVRPGQPTITKFHCVGDIPDILNQLPDVESGHVECRLALARDWRRVTDRSEQP